LPVVVPKRSLAVRFQALKLMKPDFLEELKRQSLFQGAAMAAPLRFPMSLKTPGMEKLENPSLPVREYRRKRIK
jgi:hypothetical protein